MTYGLFHPRLPFTFLVALLLTIPAMVDAEEAPSDEDCLACHAEEGNVEKRHLVEAQALAASPHNADQGVSCVSCHVKAGKVADISDHGPLGKASCDDCHDAGAEVAKGVHGRPGKKVKRPPTCVDCHGHGHQIKPSAAEGSPTSPAGQVKLCASCHGELSTSTYKASVHGKAMARGKKGVPSCASCHGAHKVQWPNIFNNPASKQEMEAACGGCHKQEAKAHGSGIHGQALARGNLAAASCVDCHVGHSILSPSDPRSSVHPSHVAQDCARCHANQRMIQRFSLPADAVSTFEASYHGQAGKLGRARVANCSSCHRPHAIFPASDPRSSVHTSQLATSCGKCHPGAGKNFVGTKIHVAASGDRVENYWAWLVAQIYTVLIILVIGGMVLHNLLDFMRKMVLRARHQAAEPGITRMAGIERAAHALLFGSFLYLVYSGFALLYPGAWWAAPLIMISDSEGFRAGSHRVAGAILCLLTLHHLWFLFFHKVGREQRRRFMPRLRDFRDLWHNLCWFVGRRPDRPRFGRFGYMEKAEYWALVWGTVVMIVTGLVLWFENQALQVMPLWLWEVFKVVHLYEAILATLAILVWHFYFVFINPDEAPMALTWITGRLTLEELERLHPEEFEELQAGGGEEPTQKS